MYRMPCEVCRFPWVVLLVAFAFTAVAKEPIVALQNKLSPESLSRLELVALSKAPAWQGFRVLQFGENSFTAIADRTISDPREQANCLALWRKLDFRSFKPTSKESQAFVPAYQLRLLSEASKPIEIAISWKQGLVVLSAEPHAWFRFDVQSPSVIQLKEATEKLLPHPALRERKVYWSDSGFIWRANLDGSKPEKAAFFQYLSHFELSPCGQWLFVSLAYDTDNASSILRLNRDGKEQIGLLNMAGRGGLRQVRSFASHPGERRLFWTWSRGAPGASDEGRIASMNYDGSDERELPITSLRRPADLTIDPRHQQVYWCNTGHQQLDAASLEQSEVRTLYKLGCVEEIESGARSTPKPDALAVLPDVGKLYWKQQGGSRIIEADLNAKNPKIVLEPKSRVIGFAICPKFQRFYYMTFERRLYMRDLSGGEETLLWEGEGNDKRPSPFCEIFVDTAYPAT